MKSERRHELQQNELADVLGSWIMKGRPYAPAVVTALVVLVLAVMGWGFFQSLAANKRSDATLSYLVETGQSDPEALARIAEEFPGTQAAVLAKLSEADAHLAMGIQALYTDRDEAAGRLEDAVAAYRRVLDADPESTLVHSRASFGLAQALGSTPGKAEEAIKMYQQVVDLNESEAIVEAATEGIKRLQRPDVQQFLAWFAEQRPQPAEASLPPDLPSSVDLSDAADFELPETAPPSEDQPLTDAPGEMQLPADADTQPSSNDDTPEPTAPEPTAPEPTAPEPIEPEVNEPEVTEEPTAAEGQDEASDEAPPAAGPSQ